MTVFWITAALLGAAILGVAVRPLWQAGQRAGVVALVAAGLVVGLATHEMSSNYDPDKPTRVPGIDEMVAGLAARLEKDPADVEGWRMLGRSYMQLERFDEAVRAYASAYAQAGEDNPELMLDYAESMVAADSSTIGGAAGQLFENALKLAPTNPRALWFAGSAALSRGDRALAADRWEQMLRPDMPDNVRDLLETRIAALRGEAPPARPAAVAPDDAGVAARVSVAEELRERIGPGAVLWLIATTEGGGPPLAVVRHDARAYPDEIRLSDENAMMPGRTLSAQTDIVLTARISQSGQPIAQPGDLYAEKGIRLPSDGPVDLLIDKIVTP